MLGGKTTILYGENSYERTTYLAKMKIDAEKSSFEIEKKEIDGLSKSDFVNLICGVSLLAEKRFVYIRNLSENSEIWQSLGEILPRISSDVHLCLIEDKIDKRSVVYKSVSKIIELNEFKNLTVKDSKDLAEFARLFAQKQNLREFIPQNVESNAFEIFEMVLSGNILGLQKELSKLRITDGEDGSYRFLATFSTQVFNFSALKIGKQLGKTTAEISKDLGVNTWALGKMDKFVQNLAENQLTEIVAKVSKIDEIIKTESVDAWNLIESTLLEIAMNLK